MHSSKIKDTNRRFEEGGWVDNLPNLDDIAVKVRPLFNADYSRRLEKLSRNLSMEERQDEKIQMDMQDQLVKETVLLDWRGIDDMPYNKKNVDKVFSDPDFGIFKQAIIYAASVVARQGKASLEDDLKNSSASLNGSSPGAKAASDGTQNSRQAGRSRRGTSKHAPA